MVGTLYMVATPIGNLKDMTYRAIEVLGTVDEIACEDTRHSLILLRHYEITKPLTALHKFNESFGGEKLVEKLLAGKNIAYISDAGMPAISDPGMDLIRQCREKEVPVTVIPGANAALTALVLSGFPAENFTFLGFLPEKNKDRESLLEKYEHIESTLIFYCAPHNIIEDIAYIGRKLGDRKYAAARELTKIYEGVNFGTLLHCTIDKPKGEYVLLVEGGKARCNPLNDLSIPEQIAYYERSGMSKMEAIKQVAKDRKVSKNEIYQYTL